MYVVANDIYDISDFSMSEQDYIKTIILKNVLLKPHLLIYIDKNKISAQS